MALEDVNISFFLSFFLISPLHAPSEKKEVYILLFFTQYLTWYHSYNLYTFVCLFLNDNYGGGDLCKVDDGYTRFLIALSAAKRTISGVGIGILGRAMLRLPIASDGG